MIKKKFKKGLLLCVSLSAILALAGCKSDKTSNPDNTLTVSSDTKSDNGSDNSGKDSDANSGNIFGINNADNSGKDNADSTSTDSGIKTDKNSSTGSDNIDSLLANMKEFTLADGSASIYFGKDWIMEDSGLDNLLIVDSKDGNDAAMVFQIPKNNIYQLESMDDLITLMETSYQLIDIEAIDTFEIPGMSNVSADKCTMSLDGASVKACMVYGETDYAYYAITYASTNWDDSNIDSLRASCSKFTETAPAADANDYSTVELTDTVRWFNASYAVLTELNGWDYNRFAGLPLNETNKALEIASLEEWWGVTDRASADETLDWILSEGHRLSFAEDMAFLEECGLGEATDRKNFLMENFELTEDEAALYINWYDMYEQYGESAIDAWDYCRALNLTSFYYIAGYYTEQEALDKSLEIAQIVQPMFESWDDLIASYMRGYEYWAEESSDERQAIYEDIKGRADSPYQVDFKVELKKTW